MLFSSLQVALLAAFIILCSGNPAPSTASPYQGIKDNLAKCGSYWTSDVTVGDLDTKFQFIVDTGSCWTWIKKEKLAHYSLGKDAGNFEIEYATGVASGKKYNTQIKVGNGSLVVQNQVIGVANAYDEHAQKECWDGILGLSTSSTCYWQAPPTPLKNLADQGLNGLGISFAPSNGSAGQLIWGKSDYDNLTIVPLLRSLQEAHWTIDANIVYPDAHNTRYEGVEMELDTGSTDLLLDSEAYDMFIDVIGGPVTKLGGKTGISRKYYKKTDILKIEIGGQSYPLTMESLRSSGIPRGGDKNAIWLKVDEYKRTILGAPFFKGHFVYLDEAKQQVGIGKNT